MIRKRGESAPIVLDGSGPSPADNMAKSAITRKRTRRRAELELGNDQCRDTIDSSETRQLFLQQPMSRLSRLIVCCCFILFVTDNMPATSAFVPHSYQYVSTERIESSTTRRITQLSKATTKTRTRTISTTSKTTLFGIKGFRAWFQDQFPNAVRNVDVSRHHDSFDHVLIDMNQILHVILRRSRNNEQATKLLMVELDTLIQRCKPIQSLVLAIDGSPAAAKIATQRKRRFSILKNTKFKLKHSSKLRLSKRKRARRLKNYNSELRSLELTPSTDCMKTLEAAILYWAWQRLQSQGKPHSRLLPKVRIYVSSSLVPGEGEIKLLEWINNYRSHLSKNPGQSVAMIGGDADLLLESMVIPPSWTHNIFVLRPEDKSYSPPPPQNQKGGNRGKQGSNPKHKTPKRGKYNVRNFMTCTSLWEMTLSLDEYCRETLPKEYYNPEENPEDQNLLMQIRTDMVLLFVLNGNDYLPRVVAVGFRGVLKSYLDLLDEWIRRTGSTENVGLIDPNTLNFRSDFCADFFNILGWNAPSERDRWKSCQQTKKTYQSMLNDMSAIGFVPTPVHFRFVGRKTIGDDQKVMEPQEIEAEGDIYEEFDDVEDDEDDMDIDADEEDDDDDDEDDIDIDDDEEEEEDDDDEESLEALKDSPELQFMQLVLGKKSEGDYHEYNVRVNTTSKASIKKAKGSLSKMVLEEFDLLEYIDGSDDLMGKDYEWEIERPAKANVGRYLAGLIWTLQTYQDGVVPTFEYNYGKCLAPTGREIASYFLTAMDENRDVGAAELLGDFEPGGSISAAVACLAALPISKKDLVPKPYSLINDEIVEDLYSQCMDPTDNFFNMKKFETLIEDEVERLAMQQEGGSTEEEQGSVSEEFNSRRIVLGDHYWTVLQRSQHALQHPFKPPPPPAENFSWLRANNRIKAGRIISMDLPTPRDSINYTMSDALSSKSNYPQKFWDQNNIEIDHSSFGFMINGSESSIAKAPYKVAFGSSRTTYGGSKNTRARTRFKLLNSNTIGVSKALNSNAFDVSKPMKLNEIDNQNNTKDEEISGSVAKPSNDNAFVVLKELVDSQLVGGYTFSETSNGVWTLTVSFDEDNDSLPLEEMSFSQVKGQFESVQSIKHHLSSLALDEMMNPNKTKNRFGVEWKDLTLQGMKDIFALLYSVVQKASIVHLNPENQNSITIIKQLCDVGMVESYEFHETPASADVPEKISLSLVMAPAKIQGESPTPSSSTTVAPTRPETLSFERYRTNETKKWTRQYLMSQALDAMIMEETQTDDESSSSGTHWYHFSFKDLKNRIERLGNG